MAVAEELHFGRAATRLHVVRPALSKQITGLERELGFNLFDRSTGVKLTVAGAAFYDEVRPIVQQADRAVQLARDRAAGAIRPLNIGFVTPALWSILPPVLRQYRRDHPETPLRIDELTSPEQVDSIRDGSLDVGFLRQLGADDVVVYEPLWREHFVVVLSEEHRLANREVIDLADLSDESFVTIPRKQGPPVHDALITTCRSYGFSPATVEHGSSGSALTLVAMGLCVGLIVESVIDAEFDGIVWRPLIRPTAEIDLLLCYRRNNPSRALSAFLETVRRIAPHVRAHGRPLMGAQATG